MVKPEPVLEGWLKKKGISPYPDEMPELMEQF